jgi:hypothetical protein
VPAVEEPEPGVAELGLEPGDAELEVGVVELEMVGAAAPDGCRGEFAVGCGEPLACAELLLVVVGWAEPPPLVLGCEEALEPLGALGPLVPLPLDDGDEPLEAWFGLPPTWLPPDGSDPELPEPDPDGVWTPWEGSRGGVTTEPPVPTLELRWFAPPPELGVPWPEGSAAPPLVSAPVVALPFGGPTRTPAIAVFVSDRTTEPSTACVTGWLRAAADRAGTPRPVASGEPPSWLRLLAWTAP